MDFLELLRQSLREDIDSSVIETALADYVKKEAEEYTTNLAQNKEKILGEKKKLQIEFDAYKEKMAWADNANLTAEMYEQMQSEIDTLKSSSSATETEIQEKLNERFEAGKKASEKQYKPQIDVLQMQKKELEQNLGKKTDQYVRYRLTSEMQKVLSGMKIEYGPYWFNGLLSSVKYDYDPSLDSIDINVPTEMGVLPLKDWEVYFPKTDEGKKMIKIPVNFGGNAPGGQGGSDTKEKTVLNKYEDLFGKPKK